jgi:hypothetical protein
MTRLAVLLLALAAAGCAEPEAPAAPVAPVRKAVPAPAKKPAPQKPVTVAPPDPEPARRIESPAEKFRREQEVETGWLKMETAHFSVLCNSTSEVTKGYADFLERAYAAFDAYFAGRKRYWTGKWVVYIFRNQEDFRAFAGEQQGVSTIYRPKSDDKRSTPDRIIATFHGACFLDDTRRLLAYSFASAFFHACCDDPSGEELIGRPTWWTCGLASYLGSGFALDARGKLAVEVPRDELRTIQQAIRSGEVAVVPLSRLVRMTDRTFDLMSNLTRPCAWSLVYYLHQRGTARLPNGRAVDFAKALGEWHAALARNLPEPKPGESKGDYTDRYASKLEAALGAPLGAFTEDWRTFILSLSPTPAGTLDADRKRFTSRRFGFEVTIPEAAGWAFNPEAAEGYEAIRLENPATGALITISVEGSGESSALERSAAPAAANRHKTRRFAIGGARTRWTFTIDCSAPIERFEESVPAFEQVHENFKLIPEE